MARGRDKSVSRKMKPVFLVFCEGETEENYVDFIRRQYKSPIKMVPKTEGNAISQRIICQRQNELKLSKDEQISTFLMYDLDVAPMVEKLKSCGAVWLCSNPCVELWFLLHIHALQKANEIWQNYQKPLLTEAQKNFLWKNKTVAVERAKSLTENDNPSSSVYKLIEAIEHYNK